MGNTAIVLAAGSGKRMNSAVKKQYIKIGEYPVLYYSLKCFQDSPLIEDIILVTSSEDLEYCRVNFREKYSFSKIKKIVPGGKERYDSVYAGLCAADPGGYVFIHDGARPYIEEAILERGLEGAVETGAAVIAVPSKDTIKIADADGYIKETPDRGHTWIIQTPQIFRYDLIKAAYEDQLSRGMQGITDDAMVLERTGSARIKLVEGSYANIKITTPEDLKYPLINKNNFEKLC